MPELPEVETIARTLLPQVKDQTIQACTLLHPGTLHGPLNLENIVGRKIHTVGRRGKLLLIHFYPLPTSPIQGLAFHLKMSGRIFVYPKDSPVEKHTRAIVHLQHRQLFFDDARKFGFMKVLSTSILQDWPFWQKLGPEPLEISPEHFVRLFAGKKSSIKSLLLNQEILAGCGNIYADESLFQAKIHPQANLLSATQAQNLYLALKQVLLQSIQECGSSIKDYRNAKGDAGSFQNSFLVYGKKDQLCTLCKTPLQQIKVAGRTSTFCPTCQT